MRFHGLAFGRSVLLGVLALTAFAGPVQAQSKFTMDGYYKSFTLANKLPEWQRALNASTAELVGYSYDNINDPYRIGLFYSEVIYEFDDPCDWISKNVDMLNLYFYG